MSPRTIGNRFQIKQTDIRLLCIYGYEHFCDGTPNKSVNENGIPKEPCPMYKDCEIRKKSIFEEKDNYEN